VSNEKNSLLATEGAAHFWLDKDFYYIAPNNPKI
jgi:hypothetical protein